VQGTGSNDGVTVVGSVLEVVGAGECDELAARVEVVTGALVVVMSGGGGVWNASLGGGLVGATSSEPKMSTSICWA
jgi:hypothetical protein